MASTASGSANCSPTKPETKRPPRTSCRAFLRRDARCVGAPEGPPSHGQRAVAGAACLGEAAPARAEGGHRVQGPGMDPQEATEAGDSVAGHEAGRDKLPERLLNLV